MSRFRLVILLTSLLFGVSLIPAPQAAQAESPAYVFRRSWGGEAYIFDAADVAVSPKKTLFILSHALSRVTRIDPNDQTYTTWGHSGQENGEFNEPRGIAVDATENVYVADTLNCRIQKFNPYGGFILKFGDCGDNPGQFQNPQGIAVDSLGYIYVTDDDYVQKFSWDGSFIKRWGGWGSASGQFKYPKGIALDSLSNVYVADSNNYRIQKFDDNGNFLLAWGTEGNGNGEFYIPMGIAVDSSNYVYVADGSYRLQKFTSGGIFVQEWDVNPYVYWEYTGRMSIIGNNLYTATGNQVVRYSLSGEITREWRADHDGGDLWPDPYWGIGISQSGDVWTTETAWVTSYSPFGSMASYLVACDQGYCFNYPRGIELDSTGHVYIVNSSSHEVLRFSQTTMMLEFKWGSEGSGNGQFEFPTGIAIDNVHNYVYIADANNNRIQKFNLQGLYISQWGSYGNGNGQFDYPMDVVLGTDGYVYVLDQGNHRVQIFDSAGAYIGQWGSEGVGNGQFENPEGLAVDSLNNFYVSDMFRDDIQKFTATGTFLTKWGSSGTLPGQFLNPTGLAVGNDGLVYVMDTGNHRVQVFGENDPTPDPTSGLVQNGSFEASPALDEWAYGGLLNVSQSSHAIQGSHSLLLGETVSQVDQDKGQAWAHTIFYIPPEWGRPKLSFRYNLFVNDIMDFSDFFVEIQDGVGLNHLATVLRDGYQPCTPGVPPRAATDLGWRAATYDLSAYKGEHIRLVFSNRNLWPAPTASLGIWSYVDDVRVVDAGPLPTPFGSNNIYLPMIFNQHCDPVPAGLSLGESVIIRPTTP